MLPLRFNFLWLMLGCFFSLQSIAADLSSSVLYRPSQLSAKNVAVIFNQNDAKSTEISQYYVAARNIPAQNVIGIELPPDVQNTLSPERFAVLKQHIDSKLHPDIHVIVMVWTTPFAVSCNSITSAMTLGFDAKQCENTCGAGKQSTYFNSASLQPYRDLGLRLSMLIPTDSVSAAKALIDRGVLSSFSANEGTAYFLKTSDGARSKPRERFFPKDLSTIQSRKLHLRTLNAENIQHKRDVMFYFTGQTAVTHLGTLNFLPGAVGDHLTSFGGDLNMNNPSRITLWTEAGATGSYGTVSEPCNYWQKFSNPQVLLSHYLAGETLIESYWKSVAWPTQGVFIGEPLAAPYQKLILNPEPMNPANNE
ncbi:MAG: TIGR03790 family protein [Methylophilales bacterium 28-44-11]|jgi:uncharacterized protein (TIGR03790 family)|nr:MAG: TIGR03790 family protein [Methylophilales bacterium 28-44-11]